MPDPIQCFRNLKTNKQNKKLTTLTLSRLDIIVFIYFNQLVSGYITC